MLGAPHLQTLLRPLLPLKTRCRPYIGGFNKLCNRPGEGGLYAQASLLHCVAPAVDACPHLVIQGKQ